MSDEIDKKWEEQIAESKERMKDMSPEQLKGAEADTYRQVREQGAKGAVKLLAGLTFAAQKTGQLQNAGAGVQIGLAASAVMAFYEAARSGDVMVKEALERFAKELLHPPEDMAYRSDAATKALVDKFTGGI